MAELVLSLPLRSFPQGHTDSIFIRRVIYEEMGVRVSVNIMISVIMFMEEVQHQKKNATRVIWEILR
jgi:hypothetical protein